MNPHHTALASDLDYWFPPLPHEQDITTINSESTGFTQPLPDVDLGGPTAVSTDSSRDITGYLHFRGQDFVWDSATIFQNLPQGRTSLDNFEATGVMAPTLAPAVLAATRTTSVV